MSKWDNIRAHEKEKEERVNRPLETIISVQDNVGRPGELPNIILEKAQFWQQPNFEGRIDRFKQKKRQFNVHIPQEAVASLLKIGYPVKTLEPRTEEEERLNFMKVMVDLIPSKTEPDNINLETGSDIWVIQGEVKEKLNSKTVAMLDTTMAIDQIDMELRAWEWNRVENPGEYSVRLVTLVAVMRPNRLREKYAHFTS